MYVSNTTLFFLSYNTAMYQLSINHHQDAHSILQAAW